MRILTVYLWLHGHEGCPFMFHQRVFKKVASIGLNSLQQEGYQISVKNWIFDDPFHKKGLDLIIWVQGIIQLSEAVIFLMK